MYASISQNFHILGIDFFFCLPPLVTTLIPSWPIPSKYGKLEHKNNWLIAIFAEIGVGLTGLGALLLFLGVLFFFDRGLLAMGNVRHTLCNVPAYDC